MKAPRSTARSLATSLWRWSMGALTLTLLGLVGVAFYTGWHEADELGDGQLVSVAATWLKAAEEGALPTSPLEPGEDAPVSGLLEVARKHRYAQTVAVMVAYQGRWVVDTHQLHPHVPPPQKNGFDLLDIPVGDATPFQPGVTKPGNAHVWRRWVLEGGRDAQWRVVTLTDLTSRRALAKEMALHMARPALLALPLLAVLLAWAIRRGLRSVHQLGADVAAMDDLSPTLSTHHRPIELTGTVEAINALVQRLAEQAGRERQFASDVAHELRTPLTALSLTAQRLRGAVSDEEQRLRQQASSNFESDVSASLPLTQWLAMAQTVNDRALQAAELLHLLLDFARTQTHAADRQRAWERVDVVQWAMDGVADHAPMAHIHGHELELSAPAPGAVWVRGDLGLLKLALRNLIHNALVHTPTGTRVQVRVEAAADRWSVWVLDNGPGLSGRQTTEVAVHALNAPLAPMVDAGLGLGLKLAKRVADWHGFEWLDGREAPLPAAPAWRTGFGLGGQLTPISA